MAILASMLLGLQYDQPDYVNAQAEPGYRYLFPLFLLNLDPNYAKFSSIGPDGGTVVTVAIDPSNSAILYAGTWGNGIFKSMDEGETWEQKAAGLQVGFIYDIAVDPNASLHLLASNYGFGVYESFDGGETWAPAFGMPEGTVVYSIKFDPSNHNNVYAAVRLKTLPGPLYPGGVYKSTNGGSNWVKKSSGLPDDYVYDVAMDPRYPNILYAAMHRTGVYKSTNSADSWFSVNNNIHYQDIRSVDVNPVNSHIYVGMWDQKGAAYSTDAGTTWTQMSSAVNQLLSIYGLQLDPNNLGRLYLSTSTGIYRCAGSPYPTGSSVCAQVAHANQFVYDLALDRNSSARYSGVVNFGLHKSVDAGDSFTPSYAGIKSNVILSILNDPANPDVLYTSALGRGVFKSANAGQTWTALTNGMPNNTVNQLVFRPGDSSVLYAATQSAGIFLSTDAGNSWSPANGGLNRSGIVMNEGDRATAGSVFDHPTAFSWMDPVDLEMMQAAMDDQVSMRVTSAYPEILTVSMDPLNPSSMIAGTSGYGIVKSNDGGLNWSTTSLTSGNIHDFLVDTAQPVYTFVAGVQDNGVRVSDSSRMAWPTRNSGMHAGVDVFGLTMAAPGKYYAASESGIYVTNNAGLAWARIGLSGIRFNDVLADPAKANVVWAASSDGLYRSLDGGQQWYRLGRQNLNDQFLTVAQGYGSYDIYFGMSGGNIYRLEP